MFPHPFRAPGNGLSDDIRDLRDWSMPMNASTSGNSFGSSLAGSAAAGSRKHQALAAIFGGADLGGFEMASTISSCAASMNEQVLMMRASACAGSLVISHRF